MSDNGMAERPGGLQSRMAANVLRPAIRPAADEGVDPIDLPGLQVPQTAAPATVLVSPQIAPPVAAEEVAPANAVQEVVGRPVPRRTKRREVVVQFGTKLTVDHRDQLDAIAEHEGLSIRDTLQMLISEYARNHGIEATID